MKNKHLFLFLKWNKCLHCILRFQYRVLDILRPVHITEQCCLDSYSLPYFPPSALSNITFGHTILANRYIMLYTLWYYLYCPVTSYFSCFFQGFPIFSHFFCTFLQGTWLHKNRLMSTSDGHQPASYIVSVSINNQISTCNDDRSSDAFSHLPSRRWTVWRSGGTEES